MADPVFNALQGAYQPPSLPSTPEGWTPNHSAVLESLLSHNFWHQLLTANDDARTRQSEVSTNLRDMGLGGQQAFAVSRLLAYHDYANSPVIQQAVMRALQNYGLISPQLKG